MHLQQELVNHRISKRSDKYRSNSGKDEHVHRQSNNHSEEPAYSMCYWRHVYHIVCKHYTRDPVECIDADHTGMRCEGWDAVDKEIESQTASGTSYTKAEPDTCMNCRYMVNMRRNASDGKSRGGSGERPSRS